ncbi:GGDEF domain-containing protein [Pseudohongiella spirulinae]|uniref:diguanylate cyclase n=1 Tax=Pseudohongiella spirulinae TaxID=1249552 RepID=A0A0S2KH34_9GAMM|nr:GGDEF domain-containing protein [Pseudohongiella spirulinae]ALO47633.1 diguanylate cyclase [Pseudohongiella spirulinae]
MNGQSDNNYQISAWRAEFIDPAMEQAYLKSVEPHTVRFLRIALCIWAALLMLFLPLDWLALGSSSGFAILSGLRLAHALMLLWLAYIVGKKSHWATWGWPTTWVAIAGYPLYFIYPFLIPDAGTFGLAVMLIMLLSIYVFLPNRLPLNNLIAAVGITGIVTVIAIQGADLAAVVLAMLVLLWPALLGYAAALRINTGNRRAFITLKELEEEIERRKTLESELKQQALTDPLTGLSNRRQYEMLFRRELDRHLRHGNPLVLGLIDLDHFKDINDQYGHDVGDQVLCHVAELLQAPLRQSDILGRFGGEEFIFILPDSDLDQARLVAERMRQSLETTRLVLEGKSIRVTATFAVTQVCATDTELNNIIRRVDSALYQGKHQGRNCVMCAAAA